MICDFCATPDPEWTHLADSFKTIRMDNDLSINDYQDDGLWAVCNVCHELVVAGDQRGLMRRCVNHDPAPSPDGTSRRIRHLHTMFWQGYHGEFRPMEQSELDAEHRLKAIHQGRGLPYKAVCVCGWEGTPSLNYEKAKKDWMGHSGGQDWAVGNLKDS